MTIQGEPNNNFFGEIFGVDKILPLVIVDTPLPIIGLSNGEVRGLILDGPNGEIEATKKGTYLLLVTISFNCDKNCTIHGEFAVDGVGVPTSFFERDMIANGNVGVAAVAGFGVATAIGQKLSFEVQSDVASTTVTIKHVNISVLEV